MRFSFATYNIRFNSAAQAPIKLFSTFKPDILCLQEVETTEENLRKIEVEGYQLADFSNSFIKKEKVYGLATFYNLQTLEFIESDNFDLPRSFIEAILVILRGGKTPRTVLKTEFVHKESNSKILVYNLHLTPLFATNATRMKQIEETLKDLDVPHDQKLIIAGDLNYPLGRKKLEDITNAHHFKEATNSLLYTFKSNDWWCGYIKLKLDYIFYRNIHLLKTDRPDWRFSDHYPIISEFEI